MDIWEIVIQSAPAAIIAIVGIVLGWVKGKGWLKESFVAELETDVSAVVNEVYQEYVKERKAAADDGKLTEDEKKHARQLALDKLKELGKKKGKDYAKEHLIPVALDLVEKWVSRKKSGND